MAFNLNAQSKKGDFFAYWGYNRAIYGNSDIHFSGPGYNFTLAKVKAHDRPTDFSIPEYFKITSLWTPQYVYRFGYFISNKWSISLGLDHMKYIMTQNQMAAIKGNITGHELYDGNYNGESIELTESFLTFEHTDGLNYLNITAERHFTVFAPPSGRFYMAILAGCGIGAVIPKSNVMLFGEGRSDRFHAAGFGLSANAGLQIGFLRYFFFRTQVKGGYINMPDILTKPAGYTDRADQEIWFGVLDFALGGQWHF